MRFLQQLLTLLTRRPGRWRYETNRNIASFDQYRHLAYLSETLRRDKTLKTMLGASGDYIVAPDIIVAQFPLTDTEINREQPVLDENPSIAANTRLRSHNNPDSPILHASISCKWTIRSDRTQNTRTEALNLIRNRKGHLPHIVAVTAEPLPTGSPPSPWVPAIWTVCPFALPELRQSLLDLDNEDQIRHAQPHGRRDTLHDISDLPFDLAV